MKTLLYFFEVKLIFSFKKFRSLGFQSHTRVKTSRKDTKTLTKIHTYQPPKDTYIDNMS